MIGVDLAVTEGDHDAPAPADADRAVDAIGAEFPTLIVDVQKEAAAPDPAAAGFLGPVRRVLLRCEEFRTGSTEIYELDARVRRMASVGPFTLTLGTSARDLALCEGIVTRYQRFIARRNVHSRAPLFEVILDKHRSLFPLDKPLVLADYEHARDTWHWVLRLDREASLATQLAALFHDVERLASEPDVRIEQHAADYRAFKEAHARAGALMALEMLDGLGLEEDTLARTVELIERHEMGSSDGEARLIADADALSFFSLNSAGFLDYYGEDHTRRKIDYTLSRLSPSSRVWLERIWCRADVRSLLSRAMGGAS